MAEEHSAATNKQGHPKVNFEQYLMDNGEPRDDMFNPSNDLQQNSHAMKRRLRHFVFAVMNRYL